MKLKNLLVSAFLILTLIPVAIAAFLLYKSGFNLSKESYMRNLIESINVQMDYISQTVENSMVMDYRFAVKNFELLEQEGRSKDEMREELLGYFKVYLESSEDKIAASLFLDDKDQSLYSVGEKDVLETVYAQLPPIVDRKNQSVMEFELKEGVYSLGILTPVWKDESYQGSMVSVYDKSYIFKAISSYYEIADTSTYICRGNGDITNYRGHSDGARNEHIEQLLREMDFEEAGIIDTRIENLAVSGYYQNIRGSTWYLAGFVDHSQISSFIHQFIWIYLCIIAAVLVLDICLAISFSQRVVEPMNKLIQVMDGYPESVHSTDLQVLNQKGYFETKYLSTKFFDLMKTIMRVQHNFQGVYQLYQSSMMDDTNFEIGVKDQAIHCNKEGFVQLMDELKVPDELCVVEKFIRCFCEKDQILLLQMLENMRDEHLSVAREIEIFTPHFNQRWFHTLVVPLYEEERLSRLFVQLRDITSFKRQEQESSEQAKRDPLTGLYNRAGFTSCLEDILIQCDKEKTQALLFLDMNNFKKVNDSFGHAKGDELLCSVGLNLLECVGSKGLVSRFGGDEFAVFLTNLSATEVYKMKEMIATKLTFDFETEKQPFTVSVSIGIAIWKSSEPFTLEELMKKADDEMYAEKRRLKHER